MKSKTRLLLAALFLIAFSIGISSAYAQTETQDPIIYQGIAFASFVASGVFYSASGWIKNIRRKLAGESAPLDLNKMAKSVGIGTLLGIGAFVWSAYNGDMIQISTMQQFLIQIGVNTTAILFVDKWILGRSEPTTQPAKIPEEGLTARTVEEDPA